MKVVFRSKDFASVEGAGLGFNNRRPMSAPWHYQGRVQHRDWQGTYVCSWESMSSAGRSALQELAWTVQGDARLFRLAVALKAKGFIADVEQD